MRSAYGRSQFFDLDFWDHFDFLELSSQFLWCEPGMQVSGHQAFTAGMAGVLRLLANPLASGEKLPVRVLHSEELNADPLHVHEHGM